MINYSHANGAQHKPNQTKTMKETNEQLDSYFNGNITSVKEWLQRSSLTLGELLEIYVERFGPDMDDVVLFVKRLG